VKKETKARIIAIGIITLLLAADLGSKRIAEISLKGRGVVRVLGDLLVFVYSENHGAFLSLGSGIDGILWNLLFLAGPAIVVAVLCFVLMKRAVLDSRGLSYLFIVAGGLGNLADRFFREGFVRDFINAGIGNLRTGILNVADLYITAGVIIMALATFAKPRVEENSNSRDQAE